MIWNVKQVNIDGTDWLCIVEGSEVLARLESDDMVIANLLAGAPEFCSACLAAGNAIRSGHGLFDAMNLIGEAVEAYCPKEWTPS